MEDGGQGGSGAGREGHLYRPRHVLSPHATSHFQDASHLSGKGKKAARCAGRFPGFLLTSIFFSRFSDTLSPAEGCDRGYKRTPNTSPTLTMAPRPPPSLPRPPPLPSIYTVFFGLNRAINRPPSLLTTPSCTANSFRSPPTLPKSS